MKRILIFITLILLLFPALMPQAQNADSVLSEQSKLSLDDALDQFNQSSPQIKILEGRLAEAKAKERAARLWKNPEVGYRVEDAGDKDTFIEGAWTVDISGRKWLERKAAKAGTASAENLYQWEINSLKADFKSRFYELFAAQERLRISEEGARRYQAMLGDIRSRGNQTDYDRLRLEKEVAEIKADAHDVRRELFILQNEFSLLLNQSIDQTPLVGEFKNEGRKVYDRDILPNHPQVIAALKAVEQSQYVRKAARRKWFPDLNLSGGYKSSSGEAGKDQGYTAGISIAIPLFDRGQADSDTAKATEKTSHAEASMAQNEIKNLFEWKQKDDAVLETALREYETALLHAEKLEQMAGIAYLEGRISILELLDAYRGAIETRIRFLNLKLEAKLTEIEIERILGRSSDE